MVAGDFLFFIARLRGWIDDSPTDRYGFYLVGFLEIEEILQDVRSRPTDDVLSPIRANAHIRRGMSDPTLWDRFWVFRGSEGSRRFQNPRSRSEWAGALAGGRLPADQLEELSAREQRRETFALGLRHLDGVSRAAYWRRFGERPEDAFGAELAELRALGLLAERAGSICLTERGILFADEVFMRFVGR